MMPPERSAEKRFFPKGTKAVSEFLRHRRPDRISIGHMSFGFSGRNVGISVRRILEDPEDAFKALSWTAEKYQWSPIPFTPGHTVWEVLDFGGTARIPSGEYEGTLIMKTHPVETEKDVETLLPPDPRTPGRIPFARRFAELARKEGYPAFFSSRSPFTIAANLCGLENFCRRLMDKALDHLFRVLDFWIEGFGAENIWIWMSNPNAGYCFWKSGPQPAPDRYAPGNLRPLPANHSRSSEGPRRVHPRPGVWHPGHRSAGQCLCPDPGGS